MGVYEKLVNAVNAFRGIKQKQADAKPTGYEVDSFTSQASPDRKRLFLDAMEGWTYACVSVVADEIANIDIRLYKENKGKVEEIEDHPALDVLNRVNGFTTKFDQFWLTQSYLELVGEAPWFVEKINNVPSAIYFLRPDRIKPIADKEKVISGYEYIVDVTRNETVTLGVNDVIFLKYPNPSNPFRGRGTLEAAAITVDIDTTAEKWNYKFFENSARPDSILKVKSLDSMTEEQREKLKASIKKSYQGLEKSHGTMVLFGDMELDKFGFNQKDMDFIEQQKYGRDKILGIFRVPKAVIAQTEGVNFASAKAAQYVFARWTIKPKMERIIQQLNEFYLPMFQGTENLFLDFVSPVVEEEESIVKRYESGLKNGWLTINEVRDEENLPPVKGGEVPYLPFNVAPISGVPSDKEKAKMAQLKKTKYNQKRLGEMRAINKEFYEAEKEVDKIKTNIKGLLYKEIKNRKNSGVKVNKTQKEEEGRQMTKEQIQKFWELKNSVYQTFLPRIFDAQAKIFKKQEKRVLAELDKQKTYDALTEKFTPVKVKRTEINIDKLKLNIKKETKASIRILLPEFTELFKKSGDETFDFLGVDMEMDVSRPEVKELLASDAEFMATNVTKITNAKIVEAVEAGLANDEGIRDIAKRLSNIFEEAKSTRALRIAQTETARYNSNANEQAFKDSGVVEAKMWQVDGNPCPQCIALQGKKVPLGEAFLDKGDSVNDVVYDYVTTINPPLHPNCQCDLTPIFIESKGMKVEKPKIIEKEKIVPVVVVDKRLKKEYEEKLKIVNTQIGELNKQTEKGNELTQEKEKELSKLKELREKITNDLNSQSDGQ